MDCNEEGAAGPPSWVSEELTGFVGLNPSFPSMRSTSPSEGPMACNDDDAGDGSSGTCTDLTSSFPSDWSTIRSDWLAGTDEEGAGES